MRKLIILAALVVATPLLAKGLSTDTVLGTSEEAVKATLTEMGYEVRKIEMEDGKIEAYYIKGDEKGEAYVDATTGKIVKLKSK
ncbi:hypothetical protein ABIE58_001404 [Roseovarius sp. MBR-78]|uniref:PepSY domain-containing protein n=1 Tax=Roseovarius sp. MBR-78 TaxID=3156460 RepID=UPI0033943109